MNLLDWSTVNNGEKSKQMQDAVPELKGRKIRIDSLELSKEGMAPYGAPSGCLRSARLAAGSTIWLPSRAGRRTGRKRGPNSMHIMRRSRLRMSRGQGCSIASTCASDRRFRRCGNCTEAQPPSTSSSSMPTSPAIATIWNGRSSWRGRAPSSSATMSSARQRRRDKHDASVRGSRDAFDFMRHHPRIDARTAIQTVGAKGYDGLAIGLVT